MGVAVGSVALAFDERARDDSRMTRLAGVELGGTKAIVVLGRGTEINERVRIEVSGAASTLGAIADQLAAWNREAPIEALGIASFGPVGITPGRPDYGRIFDATPKPGWAGANLIETLGSVVHAPVALNTDVTAAALAEGRWGAADGCTDYCYMTVGTGIGIGIVVGGTPVSGALHPEGGHVRVPRTPGDDFPGSCPYHGDCLEGIASGSAIAARTGGNGDKLSDDDLVWTFVVDAIAEACATLFLTLASERVVLGGGVTNSRPFLKDAVARRCAELLDGYLPYIGERAPVEIAALGQNAGPRGSLLLAENALNKR
jgi:fructokinase